MNRALATVAATLLAGAAHAQQAPEVPKANCEPKPVYPGPEVMQSSDKREAFVGQLKAYGDCIRGFVAQRRAIIQANNTAIKEAVDEHNTIVGKVQADQDAAQASQGSASKK